MDFSLFSSQRLRSRRLVLDAVALALLLLTALAPAMLLYRSPRAAALTMETPAALVPREGLYRSERFPDGMNSFSWTDAAACLNCPTPAVRRCRPSVCPARR